MKIHDLRDCPENGMVYGGRAGRKIGIDWNGAPWIAKFPRTTRDLQGKHLPSYTSSPVSEYIGSHVYQSLGIEAHETALGYREGKIVCVCKDFTWPDKRLGEFKSIKNGTPDELEGFEKIPSDGDCIFLSDVLASIEASSLLNRIDGVLDRFWDMFVVDAFIKNPDRNNGNWGTLRFPDGRVCLAPVYDNGSCLFSKRSPSFAAERLEDDSWVKQDAITDVISCYRLADPSDSKGHAIHPFKYMLRTQNPDLDRAIERFLHRVDMEKIDAIIDEVPEEAYGRIILPDGMRESHKVLLRQRIENGFAPAYRKIVSERPENLVYPSLTEEQLAGLPDHGIVTSLDSLEKECLEPPAPELRAQAVEDRRR